MNGISSQTTTPPHSLMRETSEDFEETRPPRQIGFSKWVKGYGSETTSNEGRVWEDKSRANDRESDNETCMSLSVGEILESDYFDPSNLLDESDLPSFPCPYSMASNLDHQKPPLEQAVTCSQTEPETWTMAFVEKVLEGDYDESDLPSSSPCPYSMASNLDHQEPSLEQVVTYKQTEPDLSTMGHKKWAPVEPLLSTEGESTANRTFRRHRETLNSIIFILINGKLNIPLPKDPNFSSKRTVYRCFNLWRQGRVLERVLALLVEEEAQEPLKSHYRSLVKKFQEASNCQAEPESLDILKLNFDEIVGFSFQGVTDEQWTLIQPLLVKNEKLEHWSIRDQEWALVESLLSTKVENIRNQRPRRALNSLLFVLMSGNPNIPLPKDRNFSSMAKAYVYFNLWRQTRVLERVLALLVEEEAQEPLKSHYRNLVKNFQEASNCQANPPSLQSLKLKFDEIVEFSFQGVTDEQWILIQPLLSKADHRPALNLIFSLLITGASSFASSSLTERAAEYLALWKKDGTLKEVLTRLIEVTQESVQSDYRKMLSHLQNLTAHPIPQLQPQPTSNEECNLMTDDQSDLDHQGSSPRQAKRRREDDPKLWRISDEEWNLVEPLFKEGVKATGNSRKALNSVLFTLINGYSTPLPKNPNFSVKWTAKRYFFVWQTDKVFEEVLLLLEKESQEPLQSYYRKLLENLQKISNRKTKPLSIFNFNKKFGLAGSGFQGVTDRQWMLIDPLLNKKIIKFGQDHRRNLNSIFSVIINGVPIGEIPVTSNFSEPRAFRKYFTAWKEDETLKKVLILLSEGAQGMVRLNYRKVLERLQEGVSLNYMRRLASHP